MTEEARKVWFDINDVSMTDRELIFFLLGAKLNSPKRPAAQFGSTKANGNPCATVQGGAERCNEKGVMNQPCYLKKGHKGFHEAKTEYWNIGQQPQEKKQ